MKVQIENKEIIFNYCLYETVNIKANVVERLWNVLLKGSGKSITTTTDKIIDYINNGTYTQ